MLRYFVTIQTVSQPDDNPYLMQEDDKSLTTLFNHLPINHQRLLAALLAFLLLLVAYYCFVALNQANNSSLYDASHELGAPQAEAEPSADIPVPPKDSRLMLEVKNGDTLSSLFKQAGFGPDLVDEIMNSNQDAKILRNLFPGNRLSFDIDPDNSLVSLEVIKSPVESFRFERQPSGGFNYQHEVRKPEIKLVVREAVITESLSRAAQKGGIPDAMAMQLASIFGGVIDFILDTREGDTFKVLFEEKYLDGNKIGFGNILAAEFVNQGKHFVAVRYKDPQGNINFFSQKGESMHRAFLLNPVDFTRISSGFSLSRKHPILNTIRAHKGTDYAAPRGTPVVATSDGRITFAGINGSFGKLLVLQHGDRYVTKYAHLNDFAKSVKTGAHVRQGETIGFVGATGAATGPHLHYEFLMDGVQRDSRRIYDKLPQAEALGKKELADFQQQTIQFLAMLKGENEQGKLATAAAKSATRSTVLLQ
jgi:murein DD-endopeptidase MepM/ murein hydrolase activator NlpD